MSWQATLTWKPSNSSFMLNFITDFNRYCDSTVFKELYFISDINSCSYCLIVYFCYSKCLTFYETNSMLVMFSIVIVFVVIVVVVIVKQFVFVVLTAQLFFRLRQFFFILLISLTLWFKRLNHILDISSFCFCLNCPTLAPITEHNFIRNMFSYCCCYGKRYHHCVVVV